MGPVSGDGGLQRHGTLPGRPSSVSRRSAARGAGVSADVEPEDFLAARPDPVSAAESELVQSRSGCYDLRVPYASPLDGPAGFAEAVAHLLTCGPA
jgi:hypothetical protein